MSFQSLSKKNYTHFCRLLLLVAYLNFVENGMMFSILPYACLSYVGGEQVFKWSVLLSLIIDPFACLFTSLFSTFNYWLLVPVWTLLSSYVLLLAILSPNPLFSSSVVASVFVVVINVVNRAFIAYTKTIIYLDVKKVLKQEQVFSKTSDFSKGEKLFRWVGLSVQAGSFLGSLLFFLLINVAKVFKE